MKKYLIKGLLALVVGGFTASCADKDGEYVPMDQQKEAAYADGVSKKRHLLMSLLRLEPALVQQT